MITYSIFIMVDYFQLTRGTQFQHEMIINISNNIIVLIILIIFVI